MPIIRFPRERGVQGAEGLQKAGYTSGAIKPINMQRSGTVLLAHDPDLRAADVDPRTGFDAICDNASFLVRIEITDAFHAPAVGSATPAD